MDTSWRRLAFFMPRNISAVTGMYLLEASDVPELRAKYFTFPGQVT